MHIHCILKYCIPTGCSLAAQRRSKFGRRTATQKHTWTKLRPCQLHLMLTITSLLWLYCMKLDESQASGCGDPAENAKVTMLCLCILII